MPLMKSTSKYVPYLSYLLILVANKVLESSQEEHGGELPPVPEYPYLNKRGKPFPWGMNSLFFNPHVSGDFIWDVQIHLY